MHTEEGELFMRRYHKWLMTLGIAAATPGITQAGPISLFKPRTDAPAAQQAPAGPSRGAPPSGKHASPNQEKAVEIANSLRKAKLSGYNIEVQYQNGVAVLQGSVGTPEQRATAQRVVAQVPGVRNVQNNLVVNEKAKAGPAAPQAPQAPVANAPRRPAPTMAQLPSAQSAARARAEHAPQARPAPPRRPEIQQVQYDEAAVPAEQAVYSPDGGDEAAVNQRMAENIARSLQAARFTGYDIAIHYQNGVAVLDGSVAGTSQKAAATGIVSQVPGVQRVDNRLNVIPAAGGRGPVQGANYQPPMGPPAGAPQMGPPGVPPGMACPPGAAGMAPPQGYGPPGVGSNAIYDQPNLPNYAWPTYAAYPNYAQVTYPQQYSASAWPYIGPFYPYPQVPLGWRKAQLEWDDGYWQLNFRPRTDRWYWWLNWENW
jgi:osmotically-inducible protein OsmY